MNFSSGDLRLIRQALGNQLTILRLRPDNVDKADQCVALIERIDAELDSRVVIERMAEATALMPRRRGRK